MRLIHHAIYYITTVAAAVADEGDDSDKLVTVAATNDHPHSALSPGGMGW